MPWAVGFTPTGMDPRTVKRLKYPKAPGDTVPVTCDFRGPLAAIDNDALSLTQLPSASAVRNDGGTEDLIVVPPLVINADATRITVWLSAGTAGFEYLVSVTAYSADSQVIVRSFIIPVNVR